MNLEDVPHVTRPVTAYGWMKRQDLATLDIDVWERPSGELTAVPKGIVPNITSWGPIGRNDETE